MGILTRLIINALALWLTVLIGQSLGLDLRLAPGVNGAVSAVVTAIVLALVNALIKPVITLLTLPLNCLTLGLFSFVVNALLFWLVGSLGLGFHVGGFLPGLFGSVVMAIISAVASKIVADPGKDD